ncbi:MAG: sortase [Anaerolineae bacterium]|nr:sortase [Anaerolineae bacterium]
MVKKPGLLIGLFLGLLACRIVAIPRPVSVASTSSPAELTTLASGSRVPARIVVEKIDLDAPVVEMGWRLQERWGKLISEWDVPDQEAAWHRNSALPGEGGNVVISGHNNSMGGRVFADLEKLEPGDEIILWTSQGDSFVYQVDEKRLVRALGASQEAQEFLQAVMEPTSYEQLTLITCWPNWTNTHRLIIIANPSQG